MYFHFLILFLVNAVDVLSVSSSTAALQELKVQLDALILQRQNDYNRWETITHNLMSRNTEVNELQNEIRDLRLEFDAMKTRLRSGSADDNRMKNEQLTVKWLSNSITELRAEIAEMVNSLNSTAELQRRQTYLTDISLLQNDVVSLRHDVDSLKVEAAKSSAKLTVVNQDVDSLKQLSSEIATKLINFTQQVPLFPNDRTRFTKTPQKKEKRKVFKKMIVVNENPLEMKVFTVPYKTEVRKHKRHSRSYAVDYHSDYETLWLLQKQFENRLTHLEERLPRVLYSNTPDLHDVKAVNFSITNLQERIVKLESLISDVMSQMKGQEKLHASMLELLESVEGIEAKFDSVTPDLKKEISKLEFAFSKITSNASIFQAKQNSRSDVIEENIDNEGNKRTINDRTSVEESFKPQKQHIPLIQQLPKDCSEIIGLSGTYLISPDGRIPIMVFCEISTEPHANAYVVIQRRMNGETDFNKNWEEYARGFGNLQGEFWLGNEIIHRLTSKNDTMAKIEFKDVTGRSWYAEYDRFSVSSREDGFRLRIEGFTGNASNALEYQNGMQFSTRDSDHDISNSNCASNYEGGWWFSHCQHTNLNGKYNFGLTWFDLSTNEWLTLSASKIMLTKKPKT